MRNRFFEEPLRGQPRTAVILAATLLVAGCGNNGGAPMGDGGTGDSASANACESLGPALEVFATRCTSSGCHGPGGQFPELTPAGIQRDLVGVASRAHAGETLVVAGDPAGSFLYRKVAGMQGDTGGPTMPLGVSMPVPEIAATMEAWIRAGAPTACAGDAGVAADAGTPDPNSLSPQTLFTCPTPTPGASPARIRRIERSQWTHSVGRPLNGTWWGSTAKDNPFAAPEGAYTTFSDGLTIDPATLDLYMLVLPEAGADWSARSPGADVRGTRTYTVYNDSQLQCMFNNAAPTDTCIDYYVDHLLREDVLFRAPTDGERTRLRALLVRSIAAEGGDVTKRQQTLIQVASAAWLTSGALFRPELGAPVTGDPSGRRRLTNDELALALGNVLSTHPPGSSLPNTPPAGLNTATDPDWSAPLNGWLGQIAKAASDGTIQDPAVMRRLFETYRGGIDPIRADLALEYDDRDRPNRGEYWLAPRIMDFFREWLDYGSANSVFKDTPGATSQWDGTYHGDPAYDPSTLGYTNLQVSYYGYESTLVTQLDDTIARAVIESETNHTDVFHALLTTRTWHLASNLADTNGQACQSDADCTDAMFSRCTGLHLCGNSISGSTVTMNRPYNIPTNIPATAAGRWVQMPAGERAGVLTHPAWLSAHGDNFEDDASAVHRGKWIREHLFCESVPGLELVMVEAKLISGGPTLSARDRIQQSIEMGPQSSTCMGCHRLMNSLGMPFEIYNHAGFVRATDHGHTPSGASTITNAPDPNLNRDITDAIQLSTLIADSPEARQCFVRHVFRYFAGRNETVADACTLTAMENAFAGGSFFAMLEALVTSDTFLYRTVDGGAP